MGGDKIVLLDGAGANGGGAATNGLLSMIPGMFANLIGGNKMDPNLVAALMNGRNNQDGFGGANGWWLWIIVLFWLWGGRGFGNGFGNGGDCCANGLPAQLNNDYGRELLMQAIQGNRSAIDQIASVLNCSTTQLQNAICNVQGAIDKVAGQVGMTSQAVINAVQQQGCEIGNQISSCCCNLSSLINQPSGTVFCGLRHCSIISQFVAYGVAHKNRSVQGFLTSKNRFLTREEASELVRNNNQEMVVDRSAIREQLYSEDLY